MFPAFAEGRFSVHNQAGKNTCLIFYCQKRGKAGEANGK